MVDDRQASGLEPEPACGRQETLRPAPAEGRPLARLTLQVPEDLHHAFHRCTWILINETGRGQLDIMEEMVRDFLIKHGC